MAIILYDIASTSPEYSVSPSTWRVRYCLGVKGIPYKIEWVEYPDIQPLYKKLGVTPTAKKSDGSGPHYTLPLICDESTKKYIPDSFDIAEYLEKQYPDTPTVFPHGTVGLHMAFGDGLWPLIAPIRLLLTWNIFITLNPASVEYYRNAREPGLGKKMEDLVPAGTEPAELIKVKEMLAKLETYYAKNADKGPFLMGGSLPSYSDILVASIIVICRVTWGEESTQWKEVIGHPDGRWAVFMESMRKYEFVN